MPLFHAKKPEEIEFDMRIPDPKRNAKTLAQYKNNVLVTEYYSPTLTEMVRSGHPGVVPAMPKPKSGDWLAEHEERGQSLQSFLNMQFKASPHGPYNSIVLVVLGDASDDHSQGGSAMASSVIDAIAKYISAFYQLHVIVEGPVPVDPLIKSKTLRTCINQWTQQRQLFAKDCQEVVSKIAASPPSGQKASRHSCCAIGITMEDLTPDETWNFVYGQASLTDGNGIFSMARFSPEFNGEKVNSEQEKNAIIFHRSCKVVSHELGHIFGLKHCVYHACLMNGANHLAELNSQRLLECPVCTKKLLFSFQWDLLQRYEMLAAVMKEFGFEQEYAEIVEGHLPFYQKLQSSVEAPKEMGKGYTWSWPGCKSCCAPVNTDPSAPQSSTK